MGAYKGRRIKTLKWMRKRAGYGKTRRQRKAVGSGHYLYLRHKALHLCVPGDACPTGATAHPSQHVLLHLAAKVKAEVSNGAYRLGTQLAAPLSLPKCIR